MIEWFPKISNQDRSYQDQKYFQYNFMVGAQRIPTKQASRSVELQLVK